MSEKIALLSGGGMDTLVALAKLTRPNRSTLLLHIDYGQAASLKEWEATLDMAEVYDRTLAVPIKTARIPGSSLTWGTPLSAELPHYVPFRNVVLIALGAAYALSLGAKKVAGGWQDVGTTCPDVQPKVLARTEKVLNLSLPEDAGGIQLLSPLLGLSKGDIVGLGDSLGVPWPISWSCFLGKPRPCGKCLGCTRRREAFNARS